jgi:hypothetical protein
MNKRLVTFPLQAHPLLQHRTKQYDSEGYQTFMLISVVKSSIAEQVEIHARKEIQEMNPLLMRNVLEILAIAGYPSRHNRQWHCS